MPPPVDFSGITPKYLEGVGLGLVSDVVRICNTNLVAKIPAISPVFGPEFHEAEKKVYEHLGQHPHILRYLGQSPPVCRLLKNALLFEYHANGALRAIIHDLHRLTPHRERLPYQVASALTHVHSFGIVHGDLGLHNLLLSDDGDIVLCDFAGSSIDGSRSLVAHGTRYADPLHRREEVTQRDDVFALGTILYELARGGVLFDGLPDEEIIERLRDRRFPDLSGIPSPLRGVIVKCWTGTDYTARDASRELDTDIPLPVSLLAFAPGAALLAMAGWRIWRKMEL